MSDSGGEGIKLSVIVSLFNWMQKSKSAAKKRSKFRKFLDTFCKPNDYFSAIRLILPGIDRERGSYGLKEHALATCLIEALGMSRDSPDAIRLLNWRKAGPGAGANAGNFSLVAAEVLQRRQGMASGELTIKELNDLLDRLASSENRAETTSVLSELIRKTNAQEMKWIIMIILKDLKLGVSEKSIFHEFHPDAEDLFNVTCDLKLVCEKLRDRSQRHKRQDIEVGKPVRPQLALRVSNAVTAWKKLHGKEVVIECKFDGDRIQLHKNKMEIHFFSRNFIDHPEYEHGLSSIIAQNILVDRCILDGEMLVWDTSANRFAEFGSNQEIAKAAKEGLDSDRQLCYVAFDILYVGDTSVIHQSLKERQELLLKVVKPIKGRLEILVPNVGLNVHRHPGEPCWSLIAHSVDEVEKFFKETIENRDEGIVLKDLNSKWEPGDRSGKWLKLKPEYVRAGSDLDVLIIGGYYGSGRRGGEVSQFLLGLAEHSPIPNTYPRRFVSFCRVGAGLSDEELNAVISKLKPYFRKYPKDSPPGFYHVTNNSKERPDVWIESPEKSILLSITSDIRTIRSEVFAAPYSLRFPRIDRVRYDKPWHECLDVQSFVELVHSSNGTTQRGLDSGAMEDHHLKPMKSSRKREKKSISVPAHLIHTDVSSVRGETKLFADLMFYFANVPPSHSLDSLHKMVVENGGAFSMNLNNSVTHCIAAECKGIKFEAAKLRGDIIDCSWFFDCCSQKRLIPLQPKYFLCLSDLSREQLEEDIDKFSDSYYCNMDVADVRQLLSNIYQTGDSEVTEYYKKKYCPKHKWARFQNCRVYFYLPTQLMKNLDCKVLLSLVLRRIKVEVSMAGGKVCDDIRHATHLVVMSLPEYTLDLNTLLSSFPEAERHVLHGQKLHIVQSQWLQDSIEQDMNLSEESYKLKINGLQELGFRECEHNIDLESCASMDQEENRSLPSSSSKEGNVRKRKATLGKARLDTISKRDEESKRPMPSGMGRNKAKLGVTRGRRPKAGNRLAKINVDEAEGNSSDEHTAVRIGRGDDISRETPAKLSPEVPENVVTADHEALPRERQVIQDDAVSDVCEQIPGEARNIGSDGRVEARDDAKYLADPVEAMLLNMIPSLEAAKVKNSDVPEDKPLSMKPDVEPQKKRKVSYKDVADQLLKD